MSAFDPKRTWPFQSGGADCYDVVSEPRGRQTMRRREFITLLGGAAAWPLTAHAQQPAMPVIGFLSAGTFEKNRDYVAAFNRGLADGGFAEGRNVGIEYRWSEGHNDRLPALAADLARRQVAVIYAASTPASLAAKAATQTIPIVFAVGTDPVGIGLVATLARPGGNITGVTNLNVELFKKCFELMYSLTSPASTIAVLVNPANIAQTETERATIQDAARALGARLVILEASTPSEIESTFEVLVGQNVNALVVSGEIFFLTQRDRLVELAARHAVPTIYAYREFPVAGGLMSYGADFKEPYRVYAARILKGEKPADLPVQQATKVELVINQKTAKALGITVPQALISRADEVIE
jgi:putative tryptophan/tyrosine transport system substrate-binding protein